MAEAPSKWKFHGVRVVHGNELDGKMIWTKSGGAVMTYTW